VLRTLRAVRQELREKRCSRQVDEALARALESVRTLEIPHLDFEDVEESEVVH
jgi:hypothetical protein